MLSATRIPDGSGGFLTLDEIVEIVNGNQRRNIKKEDLSRLIEMVDWFALQGPKIHKAWQEAGAI